MANLHGEKAAKLGRLSKQYAGSAVTPKGGDVVVLVMPGISVVYMATVLTDGEGFDHIKERFTAAPAGQALADAQAITRQTGGRILKWMRDASEPDLWVTAQKDAN